MIWELNVRFLQLAVTSRAPGLSRIRSGGPDLCPEAHRSEWMESMYTYAAGRRRPTRRHVDTQDSSAASSTEHRGGAQNGGRPVEASGPYILMVLVPPMYGIWVASGHESRTSGHPDTTLLILCIPRQTRKRGRSAPHLADSYTPPRWPSGLLGCNKYGSDG